MIRIVLQVDDTPANRKKMAWIYKNEFDHLIFDKINNSPIKKLENINVIAIEIATEQEDA